MAAISVQEGGGGDYTTLEAAVENASTIDGDVITISGTWTARENTRIAVTDALTIVATGDSKQIGRPWDTGDTHFQHRSTSAGHSFTITDTGAFTIEDLDIILDHTGVSDEIFRNNISNTFTARRCILGFGVDGGTDQQDIYYNEAVSTVLFEQCHFYNVFRAVCDVTSYDSGSTIKINSCTGLNIGFSTGSSSRSGIIGQTGSSNTITNDIFNCVFEMNAGAIITGNVAGSTNNFYTVVTNATGLIDTGAVDVDTDNTTSATINATDSAGNYILRDITSPYDLRLLDSTNNAAQDHDTNASGLGLTIPSTDIVGTSRPQNTDFDIGAFEVVAATGDFTLTADSGSYSYTGTAAALTADRILTADSGAYTYTGTAVDLLKGVNLSADSGTYTYSGTDAALLVDRVLQADSGTYSYTGTNVDLQRGLLLDAATGAYTYTGTDATLTFASAGNFILTADSGAYTYSGTNVELTTDRLLIADSGTYVYTGTAADLTSGFILQADSGSYAYTGTTIDFVQQRVLDALTGTYVYNGTNANIFFTPVAPDVPAAKGINSSGAFGGGISVSATFGSGIGSKGSL